MTKDTPTKNKILVFNGYYLPARKYGGPLTSMVTMIETCSDENTFYVVAANHDYKERTPFPGIELGWKNVGKAKVFYTETEKLDWNTKGLAEIIDTVDPDMVWMTGIVVPNIKWPAARICRKRGIPYLISPRGEVNENAFHIHYLKKRAMSLFTVMFGLYREAYYHVTTEEEIPGLVKYFRVKRDRIFLCPNIAVPPITTDRHIQKNAGEIRCVYISRIHPIKNLLTAIQAVKLLTGKVEFDIYGPQEDKEYWAECEKEIARAPENVQIRYCGALEPNQVAETFMKYHCFLSPSLSENFGHAVAESLSVQCPVIILRGATPWDDIHGRAGYVSEENSERAFSCCVKEILDMDQNLYNEFLKRTREFIAERSKKDNAVSLHKQMINKICAIR